MKRTWMMAMGLVMACSFGMGCDPEPMDGDPEMRGFELEPLDGGIWRGAAGVAVKTPPALIGMGGACSCYFGGSQEDATGIYTLAEEQDSEDDCSSECSSLGAEDSCLGTIPTECR